MASQEPVSEPPSSLVDVDPPEVDNHDTAAKTDKYMELTPSQKGASDSDVGHPPPQSNKGTDMLNKYAFDLCGKAYNHNVPQQLTNGTFLYIVRLHPQSTSLAEHCKEAGSKDEMDTCPPLIPDENEMDSDMKTWDGRKAIECVWVGMLPGWRGQSEHTLGVAQPHMQQTSSVSPVDEAQVDGPAEKKTGTKKAKRNRILDITPENLTSIPYDPNALRVVAKRSNKVTKNWFLYALLNPDPATKLCQGWRVGLDEVFYFKAFRGDKATSYLPRKQVTQEKIKASIFYKGPSDSPGLSNSKKPGSLPSTPTKGKFSQQAGSLPSPPSTGRSPQARKLSKKTASGKVFSEQDAPEKDASEKDASEATGNTPDADLEFKAMVEYMVRNAIGDQAKAYTEKAGGKRKKVFSEADDGKISDTHGNNINISDSTSSDDDLNAEAKLLTTRHDVDSVTTKMMNLVMKMSNYKDLAALDQGYMILKCIEQRCVPPNTSALGMYLNVPPGEDGDPTDCAVKLRELLDLFPQLEYIDMDNHVLAWVIRGLQLTGQSIDIGLLPSYLESFSDLFKEKFKDTSNHKARIRKDELVNMICQARDDAEKESGKESGKVWKALDWSDPREDARPAGLAS